MKSIIVGPSHVVRWQHAVNSGLDYPFDSTVFIGLGGAPVWNKNVFDRLMKEYIPGDQVILILGDFRFGNRVLVQDKDLDGSFYPDILNIEKPLISDHNDLKLVNHSIENIKKWKVIFGESLVIIPWSLMLRQAEDRFHGRYLEENAYSYPLYDVRELVLEIIPSAESDMDIFSGDLKNLRRLYIDKDLHPSSIGFEFIKNLVLKNNWVTAADKAFKDFESNLDIFLKEKLESKKGRNILICGDSIALEILIRILGEDNLKKLCDHGVRIEHKSFSNINLMLKEGDINDILFVTKRNLFSTDGYALLNFRENFEVLKDKVRILPWELMAGYVISKRHAALAKYDPGIVNIENWIASVSLSPVLTKEFDSMDRYFDIGELLMPTVQGLFFIIEVALSKKEPIHL
ncbi:hypothetical protein thsps117_05950 [Pseudomonas sp. No.117]